MHAVKIDYLCWSATVRKHRARFESCVNLFADHQAGFRFGIHLASGNAPKTNIDYVIAFNGQQASVETATGFETSSPKRRQSGHNVEACLDCTLVGILVGPRITEIGGHAIADEKANLPFVALNQLCAYFLK